MNVVILGQNHLDVNPVASVNRVMSEWEVIVCDGHQRVERVRSRSAVIMRSGRSAVEVVKTNVSTGVVELITEDAKLDVGVNPDINASGVDVSK